LWSLVAGAQEKVEEEQVDLELELDYP